MDIIGTMDAQNWIHVSLIALWVNICLENAVKPIDTFYSFCRTSNVEIWLPFFGYHLSLGGWVSLRRFIHFHLRKKKYNPKFRGNNLGYCYSSVVLKTGPTFLWICLLYRSVRWSIQIEKIGSAYIYIHIYHIYPIHILYTLRCWFLYVETCNFGETNPQYRAPEIECQVRHILMT